MWSVDGVMSVIILMPSSSAVENIFALCCSRWSSISSLGPVMQFSGSLADRASDEAGNGKKVTHVQNKNAEKYDACVDLDFIDASGC